MPCWHGWRICRGWGLTIVEATPVELTDEGGALDGYAAGSLTFGRLEPRRILDVRSILKPNNQAYIADALPLHTDLPNQETPPGRLLHTLENDAEGGLSTFADGYADGRGLVAGRSGGLPPSCATSPFLTVSTTPRSIFGGGARSFGRMFTAHR